jgi:hypothetical protein
MHVIAAKATAFKLAAEPEFKERQERTIRGPRSARSVAPDTAAAGIDVITGGTDAPRARRPAQRCHPRPGRLRTSCIGFGVSEP